MNLNQLRENMKNLNELYTRLWKLDIENDRSTAWTD